MKPLTVSGFGGAMEFKHQMTNARILIGEAETALRGKQFASAKTKLDKALASATSEGNNNDIYAAYVNYVELYWQKGYQSASLIREKGLHNQNLKKTMDYALLVVDLFRQQQPLMKFTQCKPLDRLFMLYAFTGEFGTLERLLDELIKLGYGHVQEVACWKVELKKEVEKWEKRQQKKKPLTVSGHKKLE